MVQRTGRNLQVSLGGALGVDGGSMMDRIDADYAKCAAHASTARGDLQPALPNLDIILAFHPLDVGLVSDLTSRGRRSAEDEAMLRKCRSLDTHPPPAKRRLGDGADPKHRVGQIFRHRVYSYLAVVRSSDEEGDALRRHRCLTARGDASRPRRFSS